MCDFCIKIEPNSLRKIFECILCVGPYDSMNAIEDRGGSQVIPYKGGWLALHHITFFVKNTSRRKDG